MLKLLALPLSLLLACHGKTPGDDGSSRTTPVDDTAGGDDTGSITGPTNTGPTDSGSTDSGSTDSGSTDSGSTDSGSTDSGTITEICPSPDTGLGLDRSTDTGEACTPSASPFDDGGSDTGVADPTLPDGDWDTDADHDGWSLGEGDCDDGNRHINPGNVELAGNGIDENCDGSDSDSTLRLDQATWSWHGDVGYESGWNVAFAGDTNGDGLQEVLLSAPDQGLIPGNNVHFEVVTLGARAADGPIATVNDWHGGIGSNYGLAGGGDLNGDGYDDIVVGDIVDMEQGDEFVPYGGAAFVYLGPITGALTDDDAEGPRGNNQIAVGVTVDCFLA